MFLAPWPHFSSIVSSSCLFEDVLGHAEARVFDVHLHEDLAVAFVVALVGFDAAVHLRRLLDLAFASSSSPGSMPQTFSPQTSVTPEMAAPTAKCSQFFRAISVEPSAPGEDGQPHLHLLLPAVLGLGVRPTGKSAVSGPAFTPLGRPFAPHGIALDVQVGVVERDSSCPRRRHLAECHGIEHLAAAERREPDLAAAPASVHASACRCRTWDHVLDRLKVPVASLAFGCLRFISLLLFLLRN